MIYQLFTVLEWRVRHDYIYIILMLVFILLLGLPAPSIILPPSVMAKAGQSLSLTCNVTVVEHLMVDPVLEWVDSSGNTLPAMDTVTSGVVSTRTIQFNPLLTSHGGRYSCRAYVFIPGSVPPTQSEGYLNMTIQSRFYVTHLPAVLSLLYDSILYDYSYANKYKMPRTISVVT